MANKKREVVAKMAFGKYTKYGHHNNNKTK
jgi:hypothetical protein